MPHPYDKIVEHLRAAFAATVAVGLRDAMAKGGVGEILLAHHMGHLLAVSDKGADGVAPTGEKFEYKVSITDQFNFHFGTRESVDRPESKVRRHFVGVTAAICAKREGGTIVRAVLVPADSLLNDLVSHFAGTTGTQLNKNYRMNDILRLPGAREVTDNVLLKPGAE
ncbi:hypothetical protein WMF27_23480 [Sorangium sp. So ce281]|uniref:hypothetical protein n=1 Tax=unclassified Sorangium TaxID=2621164 RepID=UPI003F5FB7D4